MNTTADVAPPRDHGEPTPPDRRPPDLDGDTAPDWFTPVEWGTRTGIIVSLSLSRRRPTTARSLVGPGRRAGAAR